MPENTDPSPLLWDKDPSPPLPPLLRNELFWGRVEASTRGALCVFVILIIYWGINGQMSTTFFNQGCQMNLKVGNDFTVPVAALSLFDTAIIILLVPVFDSWVYPVSAGSVP